MCVCVRSRVHSVHVRVCVLYISALHNLYFVTDATSSPNIRLVGGATNLEGRVEVYHNDQWGTICSNDWDLNAAIVVCRQLGYYGDANSAQFGPGSVSQPIWLDDLSCNGDENYITDCTHDNWANNDCHHWQDAGVTCSGV